MPRILVALDNSCGSEKALEAAVRLAQQDGGRLTAVTVLEQTGNPVLDQLTEDVKARAKSGLEELLQTAANYARSRGVRRAVDPYPSRGPPGGCDPPLRRGSKGHHTGPWRQQPVQRRPWTGQHSGPGEQLLSVYRADCAERRLRRKPRDRKSANVRSWVRHS
jgi:hypothetical protein